MVLVLRLVRSCCACSDKLGGANIMVFEHIGASSTTAVGLRTCILLSKLNLRCVSRPRENCCDHGPGFSDGAKTLESFG